MGIEESKPTKPSKANRDEKVAKTYEELCEQVEKLNRLAGRYVDPKDHSYFTFRVDPARAADVAFQPLWRASTFVIVTKVPTLPDFWECRLDGSGRAFYINHAQRSTQWEPPWAIPYPPVLQSPPIAAVRRLGFKQWCWAYKKIVEAIGDRGLAAAGECGTHSGGVLPPGAADMPADAPPKRAQADMEECVVCMERKPAVVLPCTHAFCNECLSQWKGKSDSCPLCRASVSKQEDESWVLASAPTDAELATYVSQFIEAAASRKTT
jgi:hypothetical protein